MTSIIQRWNQFFFGNRSALPMAVFRIIVGCVLICALLLLSNDLVVWYGSAGSAVTVQSAVRCLPKMPCISLLTFPGLSNNFLWAAFSLALAAAMTLTLGWHTRISGIIAFVLFQSFLRRNPFILSGSDELLSQMLFYIILSDAGLELSLDKYLRRKAKNNLPLKTAPWAQRLLQLQLCLLYLQTFYLKVIQKEWQDGSALLNVFQSQELTNFPLPQFITHSLSACQLLSWSTLLLEVLLPLLLWLPRWKNYAIVLAILFHLTMGYCLNIPMFQPLMIACLLTFVDAYVYRRILRWFARLFRPAKADKIAAAG